MISSKMYQQHTLAYPVLIQLYEIDKTLFDLEDEQIIVKLSAEVDKYDLTKDLKTSLLNPSLKKLFHVTLNSKSFLGSASRSAINHYR